MRALGIGLPYFEGLPPAIYRGGTVDFVEITPEVLCQERRGGTLELMPERVARARDLCGQLPTVVHGVELSIGSAHGCNAAYLDMLDRFQESWPFLWHSEHLGFQTIGEDAHSLLHDRPRGIPVGEQVVHSVEELERRAGGFRRYRCRRGAGAAGRSRKPQAASRKP